MKKEIPLPNQIFINRQNSSGMDISESENLENLKNRLIDFDNKLIDAKSIYEGREEDNKNVEKIFSISSKKEIGTVVFDNPKNIKQLLTKSLKTTWSNTSPNERSEILNKIANNIEESNPYQLIYYLMNEAGKTIQNAIDEIREAVDFLRYYSNQMIDIDKADGKLEGPTGEENVLSYEPKGHFICISPWNFPVAILIGQISAALIAGNKVTLKPSEHTSILGYIVATTFHKNGVPVDSLELVLGDGLYGDALSRLKNINGVAFTGSLATAKKIQNNLNECHKEILPLIAETGGINAMIVDSSALLEQATDDIVRSAFDSAGQRCSALRALCIQDDIYDDLLDMIKGNMQELKIGNPEELDVDIGPIINKFAKNKLDAYIKDKSKAGFKYTNQNQSQWRNIFHQRLLRLIH